MADRIGTFELRGDVFCIGLGFDTVKVSKAEIESAREKECFDCPSESCFFPACMYLQMELARKALNHA